MPPTDPYPSRWTIFDRAGKIVEAWADRQKASPVAPSPAPVRAPTTTPSGYRDEPRDFGTSSRRSDDDDPGT